jgi:ADP-heptose:LPS heptosyltransferase
MRQTEQRARLGCPPPRRVVVLRALQLGDLLCAVPALRALRAALPEAEVVLIGLPWARAFTARFSRYLDGFIEFPGWPGLPEREPRVDRIPEFLAEVRARGFDLAIQLHGSGPIVNPIVEQLGARRCAGFYLTGGDRPDPELFIPWPGRGLELRRLLRLMEHLGAPARGEELEFPLTEDDLRSLNAIPGAGELEPGGYACVHPGASVAPRRWPTGRFAAVASALADRGLRIVLTGTSAEAELTRAVARALPVPCLDLTGLTDLGSLGALLGRARLLVCNDTGISHVAAALRVPSVVISTADNPERWAPSDASLHRVLCSDPLVEVAEAIDQAVDLLDANRKEGPCRALQTA